MYYNYIMRIYKLNFAFNKSLKYLYKNHYYYLHIFILLIINLRMFKQRFYSLTISILIYWLYVYRCVFFVKKNAWMSILLLWASGFTQPRESVVFKHNLRVNLVLIHLIIIICIPMLYGNVRNVFYAGYLRSQCHEHWSRTVESSRVICLQSCVVTVISNFMLNFHSSVSVYRSKLYVRVGNIIIIIVFLYTLNFF